MRIVRLLSAIVLAASLALAPVGAASAMTHAADAGMAMMDQSADDCPCCKPDVSKSGSLDCCHLSALPIAGLTMAMPVAEGLGDSRTAALVSFLARPDPPPPRS
jgi:hypothetical protein